MAKTQDTQHQLKTWTPFFKRIMSDEKKFEIRKNDRDFQVGDLVSLNEWNPDTAYSGNQVDVKITYLITDTRFGLKRGYCVFGFEKVTI